MCVPCAFSFISGPSFLKVLIPVNNCLGSRAKPAKAVGIFGTALAHVSAGNKKPPLAERRKCQLGTDLLSHRGDRIRTCGILLPKQARYQTAPLPGAHRD